MEYTSCFGWVIYCELPKLIPSSAEKDKLLGIIAMNYAYSLHEKSSSILSSYIQSPITKSNITDKISLVSKISGLLET